MKKWFLIFLLFGSISTSQAYTLSGHITGGTGLNLRYCIAIPITLDTFYIALPIPFLNNYIFSGMDSGSYVMVAWQDLNNNILPDLDEPRGFYGQDSALALPAIMNLQGDSSNVGITIRNAENGGFGGRIIYEGTQTGTTMIMAYRSPTFADTIRGVGFLLTNTGAGNYTAFVDSFGTYYAYAFMDQNLNFAPDADEPYGFYGTNNPQAIQISPTNFPDSVNITMHDPPNAVDHPAPTAPTEFSLGNAYPNPFNSETTIPFVLNHAAKIELSVYNMLGQKIATLEQGNFSAGNHEAHFKANGLATGVYIVELKSENFSTRKSMLFLK